MYPSTVRADLRLTPSTINIGIFFAGQRVRVSGTIPVGSKAVLEVIGNRIEEQLLRKAQRWDIWMNVGEIDIENAPSLYFALSTDQDAFGEQGDKNLFGYTTLRKRITFVGDVQGLARSDVFQEFIDLKESENLYSLLPSALKVTPSSEKQLNVEGFFTIPPRVAPGDYQLRLSVYKEDRIVRSESTRLTVKMVGLPAFLADLAHNHGSVYGIFAIVLAVIFGFMVGFIFRRVNQTN